MFFCWFSVTVTVLCPSSKTDHFTQLMILHFIQSKSTVHSNSMDCNCSSIYITLTFQIACCAIHFRKSWLQTNQRNLPLSHFMATFQEIFFSKLLIIFRELFLTVKLGSKVHIQGLNNRYILFLSMHLDSSYNAKVKSLKTLPICTKFHKEHKSNYTNIFALLYIFRTLISYYCDVSKQNVLL